jgi:site-specific DNA recombinase
LTNLKLVPNTELRAAIYSRYSSDIQNDRSIERQNADLEKAAPRLGLKLDKRLYFEDRGTTATTLFDRPGLTRHLLGAVEKGLVDVVLVEHTDRLARKGADSYWLFEQFKFHNVKVYTPKGEVTDIQLAFESYQNQADSEKTSFRVRSGHSDRAREGFISNSPAYGYDNSGERGVKKINTGEAEVINRICRETAAQKSPRNIAFDLTHDGIPSPKGEAWTFQTINKVLSNELYVGVYVRNKVRKVRNPNTGKRVPRAADPDDLVRREMSHLRIVDQELWDAAQKVRLSRASGARTRCPDRATVHRVQHPFMGLFRCAGCGSKLIVGGRGRDKGDRYIVCSAAWWRNQCSHRKSYSLLRLSKLASDKMHEHLTDPDFVKERAKERAKELARLEREISSDRDTAQRELDRVDLKLKKIIRLIEDDESDEVPQEARDRYKELRVQKRGLEQRIALLDAETVSPPLLPSAVKALARDVDTLHTMLADNPLDPACRMALGNLIERVVVHPTAPNQPYDVSLYARHAAYAGTFPIFPHENHGVACSTRVDATVPS